MRNTLVAAPVIEDFYGIEFDTQIANPSCKRIGRAEFHVTLPIQSRMRRCLLKDDGTVNYYLNPNNSTLKADGTPATLDGTDGMVMVEIPAHWRKFETEGTKRRVKLAMFKLDGFHFVPKTYRSAYEATIDRTNSSLQKLASVVNTSTNFRGGNPNTAGIASWDGTYRSVLGLPATAVPLSDFRGYARNRGTAGKNGVGWNCDVYEIHKTCYWLYVVEYANFNSRLPFNPQPTGEGFKQGGLGDGAYYLSGLSAYNTVNPVIPCGYTNSLGNNTGTVPFTMPAQYGSTVNFGIPSYRGIENILGHVGSSTDGISIIVQGITPPPYTAFYIFRDPVNFGANISFADLSTTFSSTGSYITNIFFADYGDIAPTAAVGGSSTTFFAAYVTAAIVPPNSTDRIIVFGGFINTNTPSNILNMDCNLRFISGVQQVNGAIGTRLCFIPN